jgi:hypothetical protein
MADIVTISNNYITETDENGQPIINPDYYKNILVDHINEYINTSGIDRNKISGNDFLAIFSQLHNTIFKPDKPLKNNYKCNIPYTTDNISRLLNVYIEICYLYKINPSLFAFSVLTGITEEVVKKYVTLSGLTITNIRREMLRNELYNDRMGRIVLANNDSSYGLEYEKKQAQERETIRQGLTLEDLQSM